MHTNQISSCGFAHVILLTQWTEGQSEESEGIEELQDSFKKCIAVTKKKNK